MIDKKKLFENDHKNQASQNFQVLSGAANGKKDIVLEIAQAEHQVQHQEPIRTTVIKLNNFTQWSSAGCVVPYLSVYFLHYTQANSNDVGVFMLISSLMGIFVGFLLGLIADRFQAHRLIYLSTLLLAYLSYSVLFIPILISPTTPTVNTTDLFGQTSNSNHINNTTNQDTPIPSPVPVRRTIDEENPIWFYLIGSCIALGSMCSSLNMNFSDSFTSNVARSQQMSRRQPAFPANARSNDSKTGDNEPGDKQSPIGFGSLRFFGSIGWCTVSFSLSLVNGFARDMPYLLPSWFIFGIAATLNLLIVIFWTDRRPFDLADGANKQVKVAKEVKDLVADLHFDSQLSGTRWSRAKWRLLGKRLWPMRDRDELHARHQGVVAETCTNGVSLISGRAYDFDQWVDDGDDDYELQAAAAAAQRPDVRRCSIAPLGSSYICEQFVICRPQSQPLQPQDAHSKQQDSKLKQHFKHIAKIEPLNMTNLCELKTAEEQLQLQLQQVEGGGVSNGENEEAVSLGLCLKIIELIARRNGNMLRFLFLYIVIGFVNAMNWVYLFPYLEQLDEVKFKTLGALVMVSSYSSETLFYFLSPRITNKLSPANGLSFVLLMFTLRYSLYLTFSFWPSDGDGWWPLELIILIELLQSVTQGWFECIFNESALEFALEAAECAPKLVELGLIKDTSEASIERIRNSVKLTIFSISFSCFDGLGVGLGSLAGGFLVHHYGFRLLWTASATLALTVCLVNILIEYLPTTRRNGQKQKQKIKKKNKKEKKESKKIKKVIVSSE